MSRWIVTSSLHLDGVIEAWYLRALEELASFCATCGQFGPTNTACVCPDCHEPWCPCPNCRDLWKKYE